MWAHPDMLPTATDLDDPDGFVHREQIDFSELDKMLGEAADKPDLRKKDAGDAGDAEDTDEGGKDGKGDESKGDGAE